MSYLNVQYNVLFIHVPKTAGTSMELSHFLGGGGHETIQEYEDVEDVFKFAFVRNPWDRFVSAFFCQKGHVNMSIDEVGFNVFIDNCSDIDPALYKAESYEIYPRAGVYWTHFMPQCYFLLDKNNEIGVDFVGRYENLQQDWEYVCNQIGVTAELPWYRAGQHKNYRCYYTPKTWDIIGTMYQRDIELFDYQHDKSYESQLA